MGGEATARERNRLGTDLRKNLLTTRQLAFSMLTAPLRASPSVMLTVCVVSPPSSTATRTTLKTTTVDVIMTTLRNLPMASSQVARPANAIFVMKNNLPRLTSTLTWEKMLLKLIADGDKAIEDAESNFKAEVEKLQKKYESLMAEKDQAIADVKEAGMGMAKSVLASL